MAAIELMVRWSTEDNEKLRDLGLAENPDNYVFKPVIVNSDNISFIDEYEGMCCLNFSAKEDDILITNVSWKSREFFTRHFKDREDGC